MIVKGIVIHGAQLGRKMGFPTANIDAREIDNIDNGVYLSHVEVEGKCYKAMSNVGCRPSVDGTTRLLETHLFDFEGDLYGKTITVKLLRKIRDEKRFTSIEALQQQLKSDAEICQQ
ncbi:MAG: riboflavin kinase [Alistipes sp.]|nr:riboflavin kinase [Alistipes sp.]